MFIKKMYYDEWNGNIDLGGEIYEPNWGIIEKYIKELDGKIRTQISLNSENDEAIFCVGGGNGNLYNVYITLDDNESFYNLIDSTKSKTKTVDLVTGGQLGQFEENLCVTIENVLEAAKTFWESGIINDRLTWDYTN